MKRNLIAIITLLLIIIIGFLIWRLAGDNTNNQLPEDRELTAEETEQLVKSIEARIAPPEDLTNDSDALPDELTSIVSPLGNISNVQRISARDGSYVQYDVTLDSSIDSPDELLAAFEEKLESSEFAYQVVLNDKDFKIVLANNGINKITAEVRKVTIDNKTQLTLAYVAQ